MMVQSVPCSVPSLFNSFEGTHPLGCSDLVYAVQLKVQVPVQYKLKPGDAP